MENLWCEAFPVEGGQDEERWLEFLELLNSIPECKEIIEACEKFDEECTRIL